MSDELDVNDFKQYIDQFNKAYDAHFSTPSKELQEKLNEVAKEFGADSIRVTLGPEGNADPDGVINSIRKINMEHRIIDETFTVEKQHELMKDFRIGRVLELLADVKTRVAINPDVARILTWWIVEIEDEINQPRTWKELEEFASSIFRRFHRKFNKIIDQREILSEEWEIRNSLDLEGIFLADFDQSFLLSEANKVRIAA